MAEASEQSEQSMEEILQSIKKIIADEDGPETTADMKEKPAAVVEPEPAADEAGSEDVLELTEQVSDEEVSELSNDDSAQENADPVAVDALLDSLADDDEEEEQETKAEEASAAEKAEPQEAVEATPAADTEVVEVEAAAPEAEEALSDSQVQELMEQATPAPEVPAEPDSAVEDQDALASDQTVAASAAALGQLAPQSKSQSSSDSMAFRSGQTVEDLVLEALRPMLREWLDHNLPQTVEKLVAREIERIRNQ